MALVRWDRAVSAWLAPVPFPRLPWPEELGVFYDDTDPVESPACGCEWAELEPFQAAWAPAYDARTSGGNS